MNALLSLACTALLAPAAPKIETHLEQVGPVSTDKKLTRSPNQDRAVLLLHGFVVHVFESDVSRAAFRPWQVPDALLVKTLQKDADVFSFAYSQNAPLDDIVRDAGLHDAVAAIKKLGYREVVLVGHSAGGLIARQFVEDNPNAGVTRVIQVCSPNGGTPSAKVKLHPSQRAFLDSLTEEGRRKSLADRKDKKIPEGVEFVCVLGQPGKERETDGVVPCVCQWTPDLWEQGVPVVCLKVDHR